MERTSTYAFIDLKTVNATVSNLYMHQITTTYFFGVISKLNVLFNRALG